MRYTGIDDNRDIQIIDYQYRVNLVCDDIQVLAITAIPKMNRILITPHVNTLAPVPGWPPGGSTTFSLTLLVLFLYLL